MSEPRADRCPCGGKSRVIETRTSGTSITRRRGCDVCGNRWTTWETRQNDTHNVRWLRDTLARVVSDITRREGRIDG